MTEIWELPFVMQIGLGAGYLGYVTAYASKRRMHSATDTAFMSLAFGIPAIIPQLIQPTDPVLGVVWGLMLSVGSALIWRAGGLRGWHWLMHKLGVHLDDGMTTAWESVLCTPGLAVGQISVHTTDGRILCLNDKSKYMEAPETGLMLGLDGSILMVVEEEELPDGSCEAREGIQDPTWGTRMTYIPASQINRINIRY